MGLGKRLGEGAKRLTGRGDVIRGVNLAHDIREALPAFKVQNIADVGANEGQSARDFLHEFPAARIWCFEPVEANFATLVRGMRNEPAVTCEQLALGAREGEARIIAHRLGRMHRVSEEAEGEPVNMTTLDAWAARNGVDGIDLLKIDTEGSDLEVLRGARGLLDSARIGIVTVEAGMNPENRWHCSLESLREYLEPLGYRLFGFYSQKNEWPSRQPHLRRADVAFVSPKLIGPPAV